MRRLLLLVLLAACDSGTKPATTGSGSAQPAWMSELPRVLRTPALLADSKGTVLIATPETIVVEGQSIVPIVGGAVPAEDKEGGVHGRKIVRLAKYLAALNTQRAEVARRNGQALDPGEPLLVAMDSKLPFSLLVEILFTAKQKDVGFKTFHVLATDGHVALGIPLTLPDRSASRHDVVVASAGAKTNTPGSRITVADKPMTSETSLTPDVVLRKVQSAYMPGLKRCYNDTLKRDPAASGRLILTVTVDAAGRAEKSSAKGFDAALDECITGLMKSWRFPIPKDKDGEATETTVAVTLLLVSDERTDVEKAKDREQTKKEEAANAEKKVGQYADTLSGGPEMAPSAGPVAPIMQNPDRMPLGLVVSVTKDKLLVWSMTGMEGTLAEPRLSVPLADAAAMKQLNAFLVDMVKRRWEGKDRAPETQAIIVMADPATPMQTVVDVFVAVRTTVDGATPLFPDIQLSAGFE